LFESDFLTSAPESKLLYGELMTRVTGLIASCFPPQAYAGKSPAALSELINPAFLPDEAAVPDAVFEQLGGFISNSLAVSHHNSAAHLHSPPLLASLAAEAVISALNQSLDSFDLGPVATVLEQKFVQWLASEAGLPASAGGTFTTGGTQSNFMGLLLARDAFLLHFDPYSFLIYPEDEAFVTFVGAAALVRQKEIMLNQAMKRAAYW
jgi:hypothetical protein